MAAGWNEKLWVRLANAAILLGLSGYGAFLRWHNNDVSLYDTEIMTRERAAESILYLLKHSGAPLYDLAVKLCLHLGDTEAALRLPSLLAGIMTVLAAYALLRELHSRTAGLVAAALVTFNPYLIHLSQYASQESYLVLVSLLAVWSLYALLATRRWYTWILYLALTTMALAPHASFLPALVCMAVAGMIYLLLNRGAGSLLWRVGLALLLAACTVVGPALLVERGHDPRSTYQFETGTGGGGTVEAGAAAEMRPRGGGRAIANPETGATRYRLTVFDCVEYLKRYFWHVTSWMWVALLAIAVWGLADLCYRVPPAAVAILPALVGGPAALFCFTSAHPYHPRDFSYLAILAIVVIAAGVCVLPRFVSRLLGAPRSIRLWRRLPEAPPVRTVTVANVLYPVIVIGLALPLAPHIDDAYQTYPVYGYLPLHPGAMNRAPVHDWKGVFETAAPVAREDDVFTFMGPSYDFGPRYARYYMDRFRGWGIEGGKPDFRPGKPSPGLLQQLALDHPNHNLWFIGTLQHQVRDFERLFAAAGATQRDFLLYNEVNGLRLYHLGAPTTNLALDSDFEVGWAAEQPGGMALDTVNPYAGRKSMRIVASAGGSEQFVQIRVAPAGFRLRNNGFEAWQDGTPVGWRWNAAAASVMGRDSNGFQGTTGLRLAPPEETAMLLQSIPVSLAPGRTLEVQAMTQSTTPNNLHLVVRFDGPGYQVAHQDSHPGNGKWILLKAEMEIPENANTDAVIMEIWRTPGGEGDAIVDNVELRVKDLGSRLEPRKTHVASMMVRTADLQDTNGSTATPAGRARLFWQAPGGETGRFDLFPIQDGAEWRLLYGTFRPGVDIPLEVDELYLEVGITGGRGALWVDNVQVEEGDRPTPHTRTFRLPHDEALGAVDLAPYAVDVPW